ncbi:zinc finger family protein, putative [Ichthyophthirius multifiliis]|uniref:Zinc finger family protein, putative n=1 Tax=Ichthyophthirius multifiliis TaxID=5932 RepID=G0QUH5_ICHMU|nr:zinc finger family protein, putative [Ichthyophthirius multifiliis]EGR31126.1 zinc finger family protein, putative [Ichthyophthirius multifiliis]|eukprot:XP_004034612.1 zinc finger family protein, putative [Ichthyophthirius multifiliis]
MNQVPECIICQDIYYTPVTLHCGHTFCKECAIQSLLIKPLCPMCRTPTIGNPQNLRPNTTLMNTNDEIFQDIFEDGFEFSVCEGVEQHVAIIIL